LKRDMGEGTALEPGLYVVATPIGNLGDVTHRALETLRAADVVACEDTRVSRSLLTHLGISARVVALHAHNEREGAVKVVEWIAAGQAVALVTDAGTPAISDPGSLVVARVLAEGQKVFPVPGPSALTAALSAAGLEFEGVVFAGFLPARGAGRKEKLAALAAGPWAIVLFESPHRIEATLEDLHQALGERDVVVCREITKKFETITRVPLAGAREWVEADPNRQRGEFVLVVEGRAVERREGLDLTAVLEALLAEVPVKTAVSLATKLTGAKRNEVYAKALELKK
jgi:16S rRNA (cytidine1402-2'-O)-methyltransferase